MAMTDDRVMLLVEKATKAAADMRRTVEGKPPEQNLGTNAASLSVLAAMLSDLSADVVQRRDRDRDHEAALSRIANLKVRGAAELIEQGNWKKLASELQAIAQEAVKP